MNPFKVAKLPMANVSIRLLVLKRSYHKRVLPKTFDQTYGNFSFVCFKKIYTKRRKIHKKKLPQTSAFKDF